MFGLFSIIYTAGRWIKESLETNTEYDLSHFTDVSDRIYINRITKMSQRNVEKIIRKYG